MEVKRRAALKRILVQDEKTYEELSREINDHDGFTTFKSSNAASNGKPIYLARYEGNEYPKGVYVMRRQGNRYFLRNAKDPNDEILIKE